VLIGYMRVSTTAQVTDAQEADLLAAGVTPGHIYADKLSGKDTKRPQLKECLRSLREGDTLVITRLSRLARSLGDLLAILKDLNSRGVELKVVHQSGVDFNTPNGKLLLQILGAVDEFQRDIIVENTKEGLAAARAKGHTGGRKPGLDPRKVRLAKQMHAEGSSISEIAATFKVSRATVYRHLDAE
jgi:DNA invertase Pin-like site-specific DNA recombinase